MFVQSTPTSKLILTLPQMLVAVFACTATSVILGAQPMLMDLYSDHLHLGLRQSGWLLTTEQYSFGPFFLIASMAASTGLLAVIGSCFVGVRQPARSR